MAEATQRIAAGHYDLRVPEPRTVNELKDLTKAFNSMAASLYDREERLKAAQEDLHRTNSALQTLNTNYLEMLGFISHELKNTLGVIFTSARTLDSGLAGDLNENQAILVKGIVRNIDNAVSMTKQYLDMTRLEKGELSVVKQPLDVVTDVIDTVVGDLAEFLSQKNMRPATRSAEPSAPEGRPSAVAGGVQESTGQCRKVRRGRWVDPVGLKQGG